MMNIIHLTDLHYNSDSYEKFTQRGIIDKLCQSLETVKEKVDIVIFTGDLVFKGNSLEEFLAAKDLFLDKICRILGLTEDQIFICAGNHDMDRSHKLNSLEGFFINLNSEQDLYTFVEKKDKDYLNSTLTTTNYNLFRQHIFNESSNNFLHDLYSVHLRTVCGKKVGILSINSSWRSVDDTSEGKLLFPIHLLEDALNKVKDSDVKLLLVHHPLHWFKRFNQRELQKLIYKNCDVMFSGHVHESEVTTHYKYNNGIFANVSSASMTYDRDHIGYTIIEYDIVNKDNAWITKFKYVEDFGKFIKDERVKIDIPGGEEKKYQNDLRTKLDSKLVLELSKANDLLLANDRDENDTELFIKLFNTPVIKTQSRAEIGISESVKNFDFQKLLINENNYLIYGHDKSGKSSLLKYIQITHLTKYSINGNIPFYIDFSELENQIDTNWDIIRFMSKYFELSYEKTKNLIEKHHFRLLIDNFDPHSHLLKIIDSFLIKYPNINFVICCDHLTSRIVEDYTIDDRQYQKLYLHDITRSDVRAYLDKNKTESVNKDNLIDKIVTFCRQIELPLNYWTISIILLIHKKSRFDVSKNIFTRATK
ncbi:hypothetical protein EON78_01900 [bacterium]|nr:MAG: hypothetical protein EON78_01900 [bacterium]